MAAERPIVRRCACGKAPVMVKAPNGHYFGYCDGCGAWGPEAVTVYGAIECWNRGLT